MLTIAFLSSLDPNARNGRLNLIYTTLREKHKLSWIGKDVFVEIETFHKSNFGNQCIFVPENYAMLFGKLVSDILQEEYYDAIMFEDCFWGAYLVTNIPLIYIRDSSQSLCKTSKNQEFTKLAEQLEKLAIQKSDKVICNFMSEDCNIEQVVNEKLPEFYIPVYAINMKEREERRRHIISEFQNRKEFQFNLVEACAHSIGAVGLWNSMIKIIEMAKNRNDDIIIICEDDHYFTDNYSPGLLFMEVMEAYMQNADVLSGGIGGFGHGVPVGRHRYKVDWFWCTQFIVIYSSFFDKMLNYSFKETDTADGVISQLATNKMVIYPFISEQKDFGYSDVTQSNMQQKGMIREHFRRANKQMEYIKKTFKTVK